MGVISFAGLIYNIITVPIHRKLFGKTIKYIGIGGGVGYGWFRLQQARLDSILYMYSKKIMQIREKEQFK